MKVFHLEGIGASDQKLLLSIETVNVHGTVNIGSVINCRIPFQRNLHSSTDKTSRKTEQHIQQTYRRSQNMN